ncbi:CPBP family glutamic-type intramembrane protease [Modestobacter altitudinis]|uniref:CPBP family glutamic-type intramembrane protease n=1 Tax=Modestobacter altitudinis TaxID=2213158 RepID=UPI001485DDCB
MLGEELLFRGLLLPRMQAAFGRWDWVANGTMFAVYQLHAPWVIPQALIVDTVAPRLPPAGATAALSSGSPPTAPNRCSSPSSSSDSC